MKKLLLYVGLLTIIISFTIFYPSFAVRRSMPDASLVQNPQKTVTASSEPHQLSCKPAYHRKSYE